jgi:hypothetical protein
MKSAPLAPGILEVARIYAAGPHAADRIKSKFGERRDRRTKESEALKKTADSQEAAMDRSPSATSRIEHRRAFSRGRVRVLRCDRLRRGLAVARCWCAIADLEVGR